MRENLGARGKENLDGQECPCLVRDRPVLALVVHRVPCWQLEQLRVRIARRNLSDREGLLSEIWAGTDGQQVEAQLLRMPVFAHAVERLVVAEDADIRDRGFAHPLGLDPKNIASSKVLPDIAALAVLQRMRRTPSQL